MNVYLRISAVLALALAFAFSAVPAAKAAGVYLEPKIGYSNQRVDRHMVTNRDLDDGVYRLSARELDMGQYSHGSVAGGIAIGYNFMPSFSVPIRLDLEYIARGYNTVNARHGLDITLTEIANGTATNQRVNIIENGEIGVHTVLANLYFDIHNSSQFTPFIGVSLGIAALHIEMTNSSIEGFTPPESFTYGTANFAWGVGAGVNYAFDNQWSFDIGYRYVDAGDNSLTEGMLEVDLETKIAIHDVLAGVRYTF
ncbi:MAG: outer membrane beta-barrel protein [Deltaproteobacteria bacterium]|jgi:opacity protein-like surface antigen|nr:outer membrane beta-barrel protein [Deltaproteobacteria bacterium]